MAFEVFRVVGNLTMQGVDKAEESIKDITSGAENMGDTLQNVGTAMTGTGKTMTKFVTGPMLGIGAAIGGAVKVADDFNTQMSRVSGISEATSEEFEQLEDTAREMGSTTSFSASEAAQGMEFLAMAGWETAEMAEGLEPVLRMAEAAQMDLATASDITSDIMSAFSLEAHEVGQATDILAATATNANTDIEMLGVTMQYAAPQASSLGLSLEDTAGMAGLLADNGIKASQAGTTINAMLTDLTSMSESAKEELADLGVEIFDTDGNMRDMHEIIGDLERGTAHMTDEQRSAFLNQQFGQQAMRGLNILMQEGSGELEQFTGELRESDGAVEELGEEIRDNLGFELEEIKSAIEGVIITLGQVFIPIVRDNVIPLINATIGMVEIAVNWFSQLDPALQSNIAMFGALAAAAGPILIIIGQFISLLGASVGIIGTVVSALTTKIATFVALNAPIIAIIAAITAFLGLAELVYRNWDEVSNSLSAIWDFMGVQVENFVINAQISFQQLQATVLRVVNNILERLGVLEQLPFGVGDNFRGMTDAISDSADQSEQKIEELSAKSEENAKRVGEASDDMQASLGDTGEAIANDVDGMISKVTSFGDNFKMQSAEASEVVADEAEYQTDVTEEEMDNQAELLEEHLKEKLETRGFTEQEIKDMIEDGYEIKEGEIQLTKDLEEALEGTTEATEDNTESKEDNSEASEEQKEKLSEIDEVLEEHNEKMDEASALNKVWGDSYDEVEQKMRVTERAINDLIQNGVDPQDERIQELMKTYNQLEDQAEETTTAMEEFWLEASESMANTVDDNMKHAIEEMIRGIDSTEDLLEVFSEIANELLDEMVSSIAGSMLENLTAQREWLAETLTNISRAVAGYIQSAFASLVSFFSFLGPGAPVAAGGVIATGMSMLSSLGSEASEMIGFAEGGVVTDETKALIGEAGDDEAVLPLRDDVYSRLGKGIVENMNGEEESNSNSSALDMLNNNNSNKSKREISLVFEIGTLIGDRLGIKKLAREEIIPVIRKEIDRGVSL
ncbi:phage tail tape measure protein [Natroniella acetigena]|uniref:phage tail tape measure protein n=1 Tax=Natroniella acetigena TaxID=52004 RepID=UPI00200AD89F|nr:phage tail tape measure protein [Natroniella acetigena]MCK8826412.1 phage tail tape measure protein [Natroniella acetigena]